MFSPANLKACSKVIFKHLRFLSRSLWFHINTDAPLPAIKRSRLVKDGSLGLLENDRGALWKAPLGHNDGKVAPGKSRPGISVIISMLRELLVVFTNTRCVLGEAKQPPGHLMGAKLLQQHILKTTGPEFICIYLQN